MSDRPEEIDFDQIRELIKLLRESNVSEFEYQKGDYRVRVKHGTLIEAEPVAASARPAVPGNGQQAATTTETASPEASTQPNETVHEVHSPMVGTFYRSSSPGGSPFVEVGDTVRKGQVICIIEAMKIMNEIESDVDGEVKKIHIPNGQPVEFSEVLFSIKA
ncbi:MAG TPA: acetyl-CoA carboxylase biotin carboxyl carrier protein [Acidobacteriota bacterium]|jgi:acetyl-CoA carboxylase biotin carboxyl carrier protein